MERNILDLRPNCNLVIDIDMIWGVDIYCEREVRIFPQGVSNGYGLECKSKESAEALFKKITDKMNQ